MQESKTIGQLMEEMRQKAGAQNYHGHDYMDLQRFAENTRHMIIFDVLTHDSPVGWKGERSKEVRMPILNSTLIIVVSFVPLFFLTGMEGRFWVLKFLCRA